MFVVRIVKCLDELIGVRCLLCKVFVVRIVKCLDELIGVRCLL